MLVLGFAGKRLQMNDSRYRRGHLAAAVLVVAWLTTFSSAAVGQRLTYLILPDTSEPAIIMRPDDPMAGGMFTDIVKAVFEDTVYEVVPVVVPWERMRIEFQERTDWINYGIPGSYGSDLPYKFSTVPVFPFDHNAVTLLERDFDIKKTEDLFGRSVILVENFHYSGLDPHLTHPLDGVGTVLDIRVAMSLGFMWIK